MIAALDSLKRRAATARRTPGLLQARLSDPWLDYAARRNHTGIAAHLIARQLQPLAASSAGARNLLVLPKPGFIEDVTATFAEDPRFNLFSLRRETTKAVARAFFPRGVDDNTYGAGVPAIEAGKPPARRFWRAVVGHLRKTRGIDAILSGNFCYYAEQELAAACEAEGVRFIAMMKENLKTPGLEPFYEEIYRTRKDPFKGSLITTYNGIEKRLEAAAGIFPEERIHVVGMPRLDAVHRWREAHAGRDTSRSERPSVLFMSFNERTSAPYLGRKSEAGEERLAAELEAVRWSSLVREAHGAVARLARDNPDLDVIIKAKDHGVALAALARGLGEDFEAPANLRIVTGGDPFELITSVDVMFAFSSTALFEGLAANTPIVTAAFAEAADPALKPYVVDIGDAAAPAGSPEELVALLAGKARERASHNRRGSLDSRQQAMLDHWVGNPDGRSGRRTADLVARHLDAA